METVEKSAELLNDLIKINNDRIAGYARAEKFLNKNDKDLKAIFQNRREESRHNIHELSTKMMYIGLEPEMGISVTSALYRAWLDLKDTIKGHDRKSILDECEGGEDAIKAAYQSVLNEKELSADVRQLISLQQEAIIIAHNRIKTLRDKEA